MKNIHIQLFIVWTALTMQAQVSTFKTIPLKNFDLDHILVAAGVTKTLSKGSLNVSIPKTVADKTLTLELYGTDSIVDLSAHQAIYVKMQSAYGTFIKAYPSDTHSTTLPDTGYAQRQKVTCSSGSQWYRYDYTNDTLSNGKTFQTIQHIHIAPNLALGAEKDLFITIDSILIGHTGYEPKLPLYEVPNGLAWPLNTVASIYSNGSDKALITNAGLELSFSEKNPADKGINFKVSSGPGDDPYLNMTDYPFLVVSYVGATNDTLRANLKFGASNSVISNIAFNKINGSGTTSIDFSSLSSLYSFEQITEVQLFLNDYNSSTGSLTITALEAGSGISTENCSGATVGIFDTELSSSKTIAYPNPIAAGEQLYVGKDFETLHLMDLKGVSIAQIEASQGTAVLPNSLKSGLYLIVLKGKQGLAHSMLQIK